MRLEQILEDYTNNIETLYQDVKTELVIDDSLIEQELRNQPGKYFHWAYLATLAERRYQFLEAEFKKIAASCFQSVRLMEDGGKKLTEAAVKEKATLQKAYLDAEQAVIGAETVYHALNPQRNLWISVVRCCSLSMLVNRKRCGQPGKRICTEFLNLKMIQLNVTEK